LAWNPQRNGVGRNGKRSSIIMNFLEILVNDEEAMLVELNQLCIVKKMSFQKPKKDKSIISSNNGQKW
jgi:hypothetical protein